MTTAETEDAKLERLRSIVKELEQKLQCNCDLDNWQPEPNTRHSWVCRIHKAAIRALENQ